MEWFKFNINELTDELYEKYFGLMTEKRQAHINGFKNEVDRKRSVAGEMLVKKALANLSGISEENIIINQFPNGKPYAENSEFYFSISHSGDYAVCAADKKPIGIDIEKMRNIELKIAKCFANITELEYIHENDSVIRFFEIWTAKEAAFKAYDGSEPDFKKVDTAKLNKQYFKFEDYIVCIIVKED